MKKLLTTAAVALTSLSNLPAFASVESTIYLNDQVTFNKYTEAVLYYDAPVESGEVTATYYLQGYSDRNLTNTTPTYGDATLYFADGNISAIHAGGYGTRIDAGREYGNYYQYYIVNYDSPYDIFYSSGTVSFDGPHPLTNPVPEPETYAMMSVGLVALSFFGRRKLPFKIRRS